MILSRRKASVFVSFFFMIAALPTPATAQFMSRNQVAVPDNTAVIISAANLTLHLSYFDSSWKEIAIAPGATVALPCRNGTASIAFHDGTSTRRMSLAMRTRYVLFWEDNLRHWDIESFDSLFQQGTGTRSN